MCVCMCVGKGREGEGKGREKTNERTINRSKWEGEQDSVITAGISYLNSQCRQAGRTGLVSDT